MIYAVANQKGGVGKSSTASAMLAGLRLQGYKCLGVDLDAQGNLTFSTGAKRGTRSTLGVLTGEITAEEAIQSTENGDIIPASSALSGADAFLQMTGKEYRLAEALAPIKDRYDYIILDTPPALGVITVNALTAADSVVIPVQADAFSLQGVADLSQTIETVKKYCNPSLSIAGILLTRYSPRAVLSREVRDLLEQQAEAIGTKLFSATIREAVVVREAQISQKSLFDYAPNANVTEDYAKFIFELQKGEKK